VWCALGASLVETWTASQLTGLVYVLTVVIFFFAPVRFLVVGTEYIRRWGIGFRHPHRHRPRDRQYWIETSAVVLRALCWFLAAVAAVVLYSYLAYGRWPIPVK
jgi:hypothetical protein